MARDYQKEYREYHSKPEQKKRRAGRNAANRIMKMGGKIKKGDKNDVHHEDGNPTNNKKSNLKVISRSKNSSIK